MRSQLSEALRKLLPVCAMLQPPPDAATEEATKALAAASVADAPAPPAETAASEPEAAVNVN